MNQLDIQSMAVVTDSVGEVLKKEQTLIKPTRELNSVKNMVQFSERFFLNGQQLNMSIPQNKSKTYTQPQPL